jgi:hypothetical protein
MATLPIYPADAFSRFPVIGKPTDLTFGSTKLRNRRLRIHHNDCIAEDGMLDKSRSRSASASQVPVLHRQMRNATKISGGSQTTNIPSPLKFSKSPNPQSYFPSYYKEDTSNCIAYSSKSFASAQRQPVPHSRIEEISTEPVPMKASQSPFPPQRPRPNQASSKSFPYIPSSPCSTGLTIARKPVGSAPATPNDLFKSSFIGNYDMVLGGPSVKGEEINETPNPPFGSPWDGSIWDESPPPSPSCRPRSIFSQASSNTERSSITSISKQSNAVVSSTESLTNPQKSINEDTTVNDAIPGGVIRPRFLIVCDPFAYFGSMLNHLLAAVTAENLQVTKDLGILTLKLLTMLYLAACMWSIVIAIHEALVKAFEPILYFWNFLNWLFGA